MEQADSSSLLFRIQYVGSMDELEGLGSGGHMLDQYCFQWASGARNLSLYTSSRPGGCQEPFNFICGLWLSSGALQLIPLWTLEMHAETLAKQTH